MKLSHTMDFQLFMYDYEYFTHVVNNEETYYHNHDFVEIFYILEGTFKQYINDEQQILKEGDLLFLRPLDAHCFTDTERYPCRHRDILFSKVLFKSACDFVDPTIFEAFLNGKKHVTINLPLSKISELEEKISKINSVMQANQKKKPLRLSVFFAASCLLFFSNFPKRQQKKLPLGYWSL